MSPGIFRGASGFHLLTYCSQIMLYEISLNLKCTIGTGYDIVDIFSGHLTTENLSSVAK